MNKRKAVALRKLVYGNTKDERKYVKLKSTGQIVNIGNVEEIKDERGNARKLPKRRIYRHLKKMVRKVPIKLLHRVLLNDSPKNEFTKTN